MTDRTSVLIVGSGPTGLTLACDLARRGIAVRIIEKSPRFPRSSRAKGPNSRSLEVFADLGIVDAVLAAGSEPPVMRKYREGRPIADAHPYAGTKPTPGAPYDRPRLIAQWQLEEILRDRLAEYGVRVELGTEMVELTQDDSTSVTATLADGGLIEASYLVGCDGGHSTTRKLLGIPFEGRTAEPPPAAEQAAAEQAAAARAAAEQPMVCGDVELAGPDRAYWHQWFDEDGGVMLCPIPGTPTGWWFQAAIEKDADGRPVEPSLDSFQRLFDRHARMPGVQLRDATALSTYRVNARMAERFRVGRTFLAGDAAHVHPIAGGLGMNSGIQDAFNLGWKLALVLAGQAGDGLLDTYEEERLPVAAWTLDITSGLLTTVMEATKKPGGGLDAVITPETTTLGLGYRWSSLSRERDGRTVHDAPLRAGDRAPDAPTPVRLFEVFAGPHFTLLGLGADTADALRQVASAAGGTVRVHAVPEEAKEARRMYGAGTGAGEGGVGGSLVLIRPDNHVAVTARADDARGVLDYLRGL
jgi:2-polyprenyl-6-methoxyphenol hydroxylase-like FAD-dependent oxidoreductase